MSTHPAVRFYGLLDHDLDEVIEFYATRDAADRELAATLSRLTCARRGATRRPRATG